MSLVNGSPQPVDLSELLRSLPPVWPDSSLRRQIRQRAARANRVVIVLDDDPTGTQTVHDVSVLTRWHVSDLRSALASDGPALYILTNTRSMPLADAQALNREIAANLAAAAAAEGRLITVVSRSDSTLRGHYPGEVQALLDGLAQAQGAGFDGTCIIPFFPEGGRYTIGDVHWVQEGEQLVPAGQTPYARDPVFGYQHSELPRWVEEKTAGRVRARDVVSIPIDGLRRDGPRGVTERLLRAPAGSTVVVNAADYRDLEVFVVGLQEAEDRGRRYLFRTAASLVKVLAGIEDRPLLSAMEIVGRRPSGGGLIVVGSHVPKSTAQLVWLRADQRVAAIELPVHRILDDIIRPEETGRIVHFLDHALAAGEDAMVYTSREVLRGESAEADLAISEAVASAVAAVIRSLRSEPRYMVGKGGITASHVATLGMGVRVARVLGQILPGVPVWRLGPGSRWPGLPYVVFPGNVGDEQALTDVVRRLRG